MQDLFVDRLGNVILANNVARLDFLRFESIDGDRQQLALKPSARLVIPLEGLLQAIPMLERLRDQMAAQGADQGSAKPAADGPKSARAKSAELQAVG